MELVDTHCHIQSAGMTEGERITSEIWAKDATLQATDIVKCASEAGVTRLICVGCDLSDSRLAVEFAANQASCWASIGIHPHEAKLYDGQPTQLASFAQLATKPKVVAIGECGLDYYYNHSPKESQAKVLRFQLELALKHNLPVIFHVREAFDDFWPIIEEYDGLRGVLHSYTDSAVNADRALSKGLHIGVNGIATFAKDKALLDVYGNIPADRLLLETDSPFLTPKPNRGKINQPEQLVHVAEFLAELRGESLQALVQTTTNNARQLFGLQTNE